jgi:hypothetical protein
MLNCASPAESNAILKSKGSWVARDNRAEVMTRVLSWLTEGVN